MVIKVKAYLLIAEVPKEFHATGLVYGKIIYTDYDKAILEGYPRLREKLYRGETNPPTLTPPIPLSYYIRIEMLEMEVDMEPNDKLDSQIKRWNSLITPKSSLEISMPEGASVPPTGGQ